MSQMIADVQNYLAMGTIGGYIALALYASVVLFGLIGLLKGVSRGILRQTVRTLTVALSLLCSYVICQKTYPALCTYLDGKSVEDVLTQLATTVPGTEGVLSTLPEIAMKLLKGMDAATLQYLLAAPLGLIILPFVFEISFIVISALMLIVHGLICAILGFKKERNNGTTRFFGMLLGLCQGLAVGALLFLPVLGITGFLAEPVKSMDEGNTVRTYYEDYVEPLQDSALSDVIMNKLGGKALITAVGTMKDGDEVINTQAIGNAALDLVDEISALKGINIQELTKEQEETITSLIAKFGDKDNEGLQGIATILIGVLKGSVNVINNDPSILPIPNEQVKGLVIDFCAIFSSSNADTLSEDLGTVSQILFILSDNKVLGDMSDPASAFTKNAVDVDNNPILVDGKEVTVVKVVISTLSANERTKGLVDALTDFAISLMAEAAGFDGNTVEMINNVKEGFTDIALIEKPAIAVDENGNFDKESTEYQEYKADVTETLTNILEENNLAQGLDPEVQEEMGSLVAEYLMTNDVNPEDITTEQMADLLLTYMNASSGNE